MDWSSFILGWGVSYIVSGGAVLVFCLLMAARDRKAAKCAITDARFPLRD